MILKNSVCIQIPTAERTKWCLATFKLNSESEHSKITPRCQLGIASMLALSQLAVRCIKLPATEVSVQEVTFVECCSLIAVCMCNSLLCCNVCPDPRLPAEVKSQRCFQDREEGRLKMKVERNLSVCKHFSGIGFNVKLLKSPQICGVFDVQIVNLGLSRK